MMGMYQWLIAENWIPIRVCRWKLLRALHFIRVSRSELSGQLPTILIAKETTWASHWFCSRVSQRSSVLSPYPLRTWANGSWLYK